MKLLFALTCLTTCLTAYSIDLENVKPSNQVIINKVERILVVGPDVNISPHNQRMRDDVEIGDIGLDADDADGLKVQLKELALEQPLTSELMSSIKKTIVSYYRQLNRPFVLVQFPRQELSSGILTVQVIESKLGTIKAVGNRHFSSNRLLQYFSTEPGELLFSDRIARDLSAINRNPFRRTNAVFSPGAEPRTTDIELVTDDRRPFRVYAGVDNTGFHQTDLERAFVGFNWGNALWLDQLFSYQFTTSFNYQKFWAHTAAYTIPLPWHHDQLEFFGGYSHVKGDLQSVPMTQSGHSWQASMRYMIPLAPHDFFLQDVKWGVDFKNTNNNLVFGGSAFSKTNVNIFQFMGAYELTYTPKNYRLYFEVEAFGSPGELVPDQTNADFESLRAYANSHYIYGRSYLQVLYYGPKDCQFEGIFRGQAASRNLLPSEQFGLGGYNTVRGYAEREQNVDNATLFNLEARFPSFHIFPKKVKDSLRALIFLDAGFGWQHRRIPSNQHTYALIGIGPGLRYQINQWLTSRLDWGFQLHKNPHSDELHNRIHFSVIANY